MRFILSLTSCISLLLFLHNNVRVLASTDQAKLKNVVVTAAEEKIRDKEGYDAIAELHKQMDDDKSGSIDRAESADFLTADLHISSDRLKREKHFHNNDDDSITVDDLWDTWFVSEERYWNEERIVEWLTNSVKLPQYVPNLLKAHVKGMHLPQMALNSGTYLSNILGIRNYVHRQKIQLKALDIVLFGYIDTSSRLKDIVLAILVVALSIVIYFFRQKQIKAKIEMDQLSAQLGQIRSLELNFKDSENKLEEERKKRQSTVDNVSTEQMEALKHKLTMAEKKLEETSISSLDSSIQPLLRRTYELEYSHIQQQKMECLTEMREAKDLVDKFRKKQSGVMYSLKLATGASSGTEVIDTKIFSLKTRMEKITLALDECNQRWTEIENISGLPIIMTNVGEYPRRSSKSHASSSINGSSTGSSGYSTKSMTSQGTMYSWKNKTSLNNYKASIASTSTTTLHNNNYYNTNASHPKKLTRPENDVPVVSMQRMDSHSQIYDHTFDDIENRSSTNSTITSSFAELDIYNNNNNPSSIQSNRSISPESITNQSIECTSPPHPLKSKKLRGTKKFMSLFSSKKVTS